MPGLLYLFPGILNMVLQVHLSKSVLKPPELHLNYLNKSSFTFPLESSLIWPRIYLPFNPTRTLSYSLIRLMVLKTDFHFLPLCLCLFSSPVTHQLHQQLIPYLIFPDCEDDSSFLTDNKMWELSDLQHILYVRVWLTQTPTLPHAGRPRRQQYASHIFASYYIQELHIICWNASTKMFQRIKVTFITQVISLISKSSGTIHGTHDWLVNSNLFFNLMFWDGN